VRLCKLNFFLILIAYLGFQAKAQIHPLGLYEGLLGNSGAAISESSAPSIYNPSLLSFKKKGSVVLGGNTISAITTKTTATTSTGSSFSPSYVSSIDAYESFIHEFFIANITDAELNLETLDSGLQTTSRFRVRNSAAGYSFAFPSLPMGFQIILSNRSAYGVATLDSTEGSTRTIGNVRIDTKQIDANLGISTLLNFDSYSLGFNFKTRSMKIYSKDNSTFKSYVYDPSGPAFIESSGEKKSTAGSNFGNSLVVGQGFQSGAHEFLTDSSFVESEYLDQSYSWRQSYGYRLGIGETHQFLCGLNHLISDKVRYFGQDAYYSVGYSWKNRTYRSGFGLFYWNDKVTQNSSIYGLTFSSEFTY
jgi:hypothetical protein